MNELSFRFAMEPLDKDRFSYVSRPRYSPYNYDTVINSFMTSAKKYPDKEIFIQHDIDGNRESITYTKMKNEALQLARFLLSKGIKKGDHVALFGPNTIEWVVGELAIIIAGGIVVHIAISITDATDIWEIFAQTDCKAFLIDPGERRPIPRGYLSIACALQTPSTFPTISRCGRFQSQALCFFVTWMGCSRTRP